MSIRGVFSDLNLEYALCDLDLAERDVLEAGNELAAVQHDFEEAKWIRDAAFARVEELRAESNQKGHG